MARAKANNDRGFVLVFMALSITTLMAVGGMAVDLGSWYWNADRLQRAADAASLAGAPYLPGRPDLAYNAAEAMLQANGINATNVSQNIPLSNTDTYKPIAYIAPDPADPARLKVQVGSKVHNYLVDLVGVRDPWIQRAADGQYVAPVKMGSPGDVLGAEPTVPGESYQDSSVQDSNLAYRENYMGKYWLNIAGGQTDKTYGDRYTAGKCVSPDDGCSNGVNTDVGVGTDGVRENQYVVHIPKGIVGPVTLQVFDAAAVDVGDYCDQNQYLGTSAINAVATLNGIPTSVYAAGSASQYCTGDNIAGQAKGGNADDLPLLTFTVHNSNAGGSNLGSQLSQTTFPGVALDQNLPQALSSNTKLRESFRQWYTLQTFSKPGDYIIEAQTPNNSIGANRFSLRLGVGLATDWDTVQGTQVSISAKHHLTVYTNAKASDAKFYFADLTDNVAGRNLTFNLFDIGDAPYPVSLKLIPPVGSNITNFGTCTQVGPGTLADLTKTPCGIDGATPTNYNGRAVKLQVQVPLGYSCTETSAQPDRCWMALQFDLDAPANLAPSAQQPSTDTSTWQIDDCGSPVKLVKEGTPEPKDSCPAAGS